MTIIVLAAGLSTRMGRNKLLLPFEGTTILNAVIKRAYPFGKKLILVTGHERDKIIGSLDPAFPAVEVFNEDYEKGQKGSILTGIEATDDDFAVIPGDLPLIAEDDIRKTIDALESFDAARCFYNGIPGHPVAFRKENRERLLTYPGKIKDYLHSITCYKAEGTIGSVFDSDIQERYISLLTGNPDPTLL